MQTVDWSAYSFKTVVPTFPKDGYKVLDLSNPDPSWANDEAGNLWTIGKYNEDRSIYTTELYSDGRSVHVGLDIGGPVGTPVHAFLDGKIHSAGYNSAAGDYGHVVVTEHSLGGVTLWALFGHLDARSSSAKWQPGATFAAGDVLGWFGDKSENGGWPPHLHLQLSFKEPPTHDMPGAVRQDERDEMLEIYPDPQLVTGKFY